MRACGLRRTALCCGVLGGLLAAGGLEAVVEPWGDESVVRHAKSADGVDIVYTEAGSGATALVFIHGGLADRSFWAPQVKDLAARFRVVALDLAGHGDSGHDRTAWTIPAWGGDVRAVVLALDLERVVLIGNSLGGPVALEAARMLPGRVLGVIGVDTLHDATQAITAAQAHAQAELFRKDFAATCRAMVNQLFHPGQALELHAWAEKRMCTARPEVVVGMMEGWGGYDMPAAFRNAGVPIRAINGDLYPTRTDVNRTVVPDFDAVVMKGCSHYPMLERPAEFDQVLTATVAGLEKAAAKGR